MEWRSWLSWGDAEDVPVPNRPNLRLFVLAGAMGVVVALSTEALIFAIAQVQRVLLGHATEQYLASLIRLTPEWRVVAAPVIGGLIVGALIGFLPGRRYHGIADVMEACATRGGRMDVRSGLGAAAAAAVSIGSGASVGREGPAVHIGASICAWVAERFGLSRRHSLTLLGCGAAAAVTASFNAPIAGVLFALEVVVGYYTLRVFAPIVVASMGAVAVVRSLHGDGHAFSLPSHTVESLWELPLFALTGVLAALVVVLTIRLVRAVQRVHARGNWPQWIRPAIGGLGVGLLALITPYVMGVGYQTLNLSLIEAFPLGVVAGVLVAKVIATALSLGSGFCGGVFSPSLVMGALLGTAVGLSVELLLPGAQSTQAVYAMAGMAAAASAMLGAPISTVLIVFELTADYDVIVAVMMASATAATTMMFQPYTSFFRWQLGMRGVNLTAGRDQSLMRTETVESIVTGGFTRAGAQDTVDGVLARMASERQRIAVAVGERGELLGSKSLVALLAATAEDGEREDAGRDMELFLALADDAECALERHDSLSGALDLMAARQLEFLPVVDRNAEGLPMLIGVISHDDVMTRQAQLLQQARAVEFGVN